MSQQDRQNEQDGQDAARDAAVEIADLRVSVRRTGTEVLHGVGFDVKPGEILALVGESGSGKTTAGLAALGHFRSGLRVEAGSVRVCSREGEAHDVLGLDAGALRELRGRTVAYVPQDPAASLNPALRIGTQIREILDTHSYGDSAQDRERRAAEVMAEVGLPDDPAYLRRYPHQLSGGQQQRVGIAMAFACRPAVIVLDEPTTGLDVTTQAHVLDTVHKLAEDYDVAAVYITHDLAVVAEIADRVVVMRSGEVVEHGDATQVLRRPRHSYTRRLVRAVPQLAGAVEDEEAGTPSGGAEPAGAGESADDGVLLTLDGLGYSYGDVRVLDGVDLELRRGECVMLLGESGSGKTTASRCVAGLTDGYTGTVTLAGEELVPDARRRSGEQRRRVQYVFQSPYSSLNPRKTVAESMVLPLRAAKRGGRCEQRALVLEMLERVALKPEHADRLPSQLSGGERQRVAIGRALMSAPEVLICDEVTSALDVSVQASIIDLLRELQYELDMTMLFVTHNVALARHIAQRVAVLQTGRIVECGPVDQVLDEPRHEYTRELLANTPSL